MVLKLIIKTVISWSHDQLFEDITPQKDLKVIPVLIPNRSNPKGVFDISDLEESIVIIFLNENVS